MPAIWSSSERPMSVRMVWVDGIRHSILSQDDPLLKASRRRSQTSSSTVKDKSGNGNPLKFVPYKATTTQNENCFVKLRLLVGKAGGYCPEIEREDTEDTARAEAASASTATVARLEQKSAPLCTRLVRNDFEESVEEGLEEEKTTRTRAVTPQLNTLSERVLRWLDLSGRSRELEEQSCRGEEQQEKEEQPSRVSSRRCSAKEFGATSLKIVVPTQCLLLHEGSEKALVEACEMSKRAFNNSNNNKVVRRRKLTSAHSSCDDASKRSSSSTSVSDEEILEAGKSQSLWVPPGKPQLHIFMPNFKSMEIHQWLSSL